MKKYDPGIDLERSELRYIFYARDQASLIQDIIDLGFKQLYFHGTPITQTIYFGSNRGLRPGLSIKARRYSAKKAQNVWDIDEDSGD
ncbi:MAG: hypothetical protein GF329_22405 [Candidatus Lokiarchaeota archaeon]|nr:hypothetical protein [Candidatus Lokiarchaeota archaeon]